MMEAADHGRLDDATPVGALHLLWLWRVLAHAEGVEYVVAMAGNVRLVKRSRRLMGRARMRSKASGQVRALLGHARIDTTQIYTRIRPPQRKRAVAFYDAQAQRMLTR
jgi:hypothetical protein